MPVQACVRDSKNPPVEKDRNTDKSWSCTALFRCGGNNGAGAGAEIYVFAGPLHWMLCAGLIYLMAVVFATPMGIGFYTTGKIIVHCGQK